jgi:uncharacterized protein YdeI (YjbR/CyaY-like superfamily)
MIKGIISGGVVHSIPKDVEQILTRASDVCLLWEDITPLARNEWICWITSAKKDETRARRIKNHARKLNSR